MNKNDRTKTKFPKCSFCGKLKSEVKLMVGSESGATICDMCVKKMKQEINKEAEPAEDS